ncbi:MAG TPA: M20/M25/M40 family metallo-hydrolase [Afifellaceae bacterium]|nr:M20/M25/M40 family metallo-hydrolase [Afifellaceae bacterium]
MLDKVLDHIDAELETSLERLFELLRIDSVSTDPAYSASCARAADWLAAELKQLGFDASVRPTPGHAMVVGHGPQAGSTGPHVLFYGHYDVQPVDPLNLWETPPFEPRMVTRDDGSRMIVGRGAADDKGQLMTFLEACRAWKAVAGELPVQVSVLLEGEEETGSPSLLPFLEANREELSLDLALVCDTTMWNSQTPVITTMLRGMFSTDVVITAADRDLHSGRFGGPARNPIKALASIIGQLHDETGRVTIDGFYDDVRELPDDIKAAWQALGVSEADYLGAIGLTETAGEQDRSLLEQNWARPTCEINGIFGGYTGEGFKTVIPSKASAKVSFRLVADQDPAAIREAFHAFVDDRLPPDCTVEFSSHAENRAIAMPFDSEPLTRAAAALEREWGRAPALLGAGGSIPIVGEFKRMLGMDALLIGFSLADDNVHSPNEKYDLSSFHGGIRSWARIMAALAD